MSALLMEPIAAPADTSEPEDLFALMYKLHCFHCGHWKAPDNFLHKKNRNNGLPVRCKACQAEACQAIAASLPPVAREPATPPTTERETTRETLCSVDSHFFASTLDAAPDFPTACRIAAVMYSHYGKRVKKLCEKEGIAHDAPFWFDLATDAEHAAQVYVRLHQECPPTAQEKTLHYLRKHPNNMEMFTDALETGEYGECLGW